MKNINFDPAEAGSLYYPDRTIFRVYAPDFSQLDLVIASHHYAMHKHGSCFEIALGGNLEKVRYHYEGDGLRFADPFSYLCLDGESIILDSQKFHKKNITPSLSAANPVIYEASIRDFSSADSYPGEYRRKFLALSETELKKDDFYVLGVDYLKYLGISHLQLMPVFAFDKDHAEYNWGYNPVAYNCLEKDYVYDQDDPYAYINELHDIIAFLHSCDIRVTLDVVFNHVYSSVENDLGKMLKGKLYRYKDDGTLANATACGNEVASEDPFVRAYIVEMCRRYVKLFDIDGLRFDLMGILDCDTINEITRTCRALKDDFLVYGEGWQMGDVLNRAEQACIPNASLMPGVMMFNDRFRDTIIAYVFGNDTINEDVRKVMAAADQLDLSHTLNYVECHDGLTMYDRVKKYHPDDSEWQVYRRCRLALALVLLARGTPFVHMGEEFFRTKQGEKNSYNRPDEINMIDWDRRVEHNDMCDYFRDLLSIRRNNACFSRPDAQVSFADYYDCLLYRIDDLLIIINPSLNHHVYEDGHDYNVVFDDNGFCDYRSGIITVYALSLVICRV